MIKFLKFSVIVAAALLLQQTLLPFWLTDPFQPNLLIVLTAYLGLRGSGGADWLTALLLGLVNDSFNGIYLGMFGFTFLAIYFLLRSMADRLYTDNIQLMILVTFLASVGAGLLQLLLLMIFSAADGLYTSLFAGLIPHGLVNALAASLLFSCSIFSFLEKGR
jgi:rod shape-determining protein MreD